MSKVATKKKPAKKVVKKAVKKAVVKKKAPVKKVVKKVAKKVAKPTVEPVTVKKVKRKGEVLWQFTVLIAKKSFLCDTLYKTERSALKAGQGFMKKYIK